MIVVGGWPGRKVVGLNGRFGVRPAAFAAAGDFDNPFLNDVDSGDETTEFVGVVTSLPGSGTVVFDDDGGFEHTGAADGTYSTVFDLFTWAQGGPVTAHGAETITTTFGSTSTASGVTVTAAASLVAGTASGQIAASASGATVVGAASLVAGSGTGQSAATAAGVTLAGAASLLAGSAAGQGTSVAPGVTISTTAALFPGSASGQFGATAAGVTLSAAVSVRPGTATNGVFVPSLARTFVVYPDVQLAVPLSDATRVSPTYLKDPDAVLDYSWQMAPYLADSGDTLVAVNVTVAGGAVLDSQFAVGSLITAWISGVAAGALASTTLTFTTSGGRSDQRTILLQGAEL